MGKLLNALLTTKPYKGKRISDGVWINGYYIENNHEDEYTIAYTSKESHKLVYDKIQVNTACRFTGICDKCGDPIYENDIVTDGKMSFSVYYNAAQAAFILSPLNDSSCLFIKCLGQNSYSREDLKIIGSTCNNERITG